LKESKRTKIEAIKADLVESGGRDQAKIAKKHGVSRSYVSDINTGRAGKNVPWPGEPPKPLPAKGQRNKIPDYDPTDRRIMELESEVTHLTDELRFERRKVKAGAKMQGLFKAMAAELEDHIQPLKPLPKVFKPTTKSITEEVVMHISDMHADQIVQPEECGGMEEYNFPIACARAERYVETVIDWTQDSLSPKFNFPRLTILSYGDDTSGEIHGHAQRSYYRNQMKNSIAIGQLKALMIRDLSPYFEEINVLCLAGNHGRRSIRKDHHGAQDNWDYLIAEITRLQCQGLDNVNFTIPNAWSANVIINGIGFNISHGDDVRGWNGIPFYGMARRQKGLIALGAAQGETRVRYFVMGHHHTASNLSDVDGEMLINGAWVGTDAYSYNAFAGYREPTQWLHGVNPKHGITWRLAVKLRHENEKRGPKRYKIDGGREVGPLL
jgi:hypothetical protein